MKEIIQGIFIGIGKIIPGVSGSVIAISLGVYEKAISSITNFFSNLKDNIKYLGLLAIGIIISISCFSKLIVYFLDNHYVVTMFLFIGLILGSNGAFKTDNKKYNYISLMTFSIVLGFGLLSGRTELHFSSNIIKMIYMIFIGFVDAATMIIPGISGTALLMMLGVYDVLIDAYSNVLSIDRFAVNLSIFLPLGSGIIIGTYFVSKMINICFRRYRNQTEKAIKGFLYGTVVYMIISCLHHFQGITNFVIGLLMCLIGFLLMKKINHFL